MGASASTARGADGVAQRRMIKVGSAAAQFKKAKSHLTTSNSTVMPAHQAQFFIVEQSSECAKLDKQYTDGAFPQDIDPNHTKGQRVVWKRPGGFCEAAPHLFVDGVDFMDVVSGAFAGSALHAAMCVLAASRPDKIRELFINLPEGDGANPYGIYGIKFYFETRWYVVVVDDLIPCAEKSGLPLFVRSMDPNEFWPCIIEKAFAKLYGGYNRIRGMAMRDVWPALTGGLSQVYSIGEFLKPASGKGKAVKPAQADADFWDVLLSWQSVRAFMCISTETRQAEVGILNNHAYAILECVEAVGHRLIRLRNPAQNVEWKGDWSDDSPLWTEEMRVAVGEEKVVSMKDGNFWMSLTDLRNTFDTLYVARDDFVRLPTARVRGMWNIAGGTAGGPPRKNFDKENPVILLRMGQEPESEEGVVPTDAGSFVKENRLLQVATTGDKKKDKKLLELKAGKRALIVLEQKNTRGGPDGGSPLPQIAFAVYKVNEKKGTSPKSPLFDHCNVEIMDEVVTTVEPQALLQVHADVMLMAGVNYFVVPYTRNYNTENEFIVKVFCETPMETQLLNHVKSSAVRLRAIHPKVKCFQIEGTWQTDAPNACHPALVRVDPPPERTFDKAPRYKLVIAGKGKGNVRIRMSTKQEVEKLDIDNPLSVQKCMAYASVSGQSTSAAYRKLDNGCYEIIIRNGISSQLLTTPAGVEVKFAADANLIINGNDEQRVKDFARVIREKGDASVDAGAKTKIEYVDVRKILKMETDVGAKTTFNQARSQVKHACVRVAGPGFGVAIHDGHLILNLGIYGNADLVIPSDVWLDVQTESQDLELSGTAELVMDTIRDLRKAGFATAGTDPSFNDMQAWQQNRGQKNSLNSLGDIIKSSWHMEPLEDLPKPPAYGFFVQNAKGIFLKETGTYNIWQGPDLACVPDAEELWLDLTLGKGEYFIVPVPGAKGCEFSNKGKYFLSVFSNMDIDVMKTPLQSGYPPLPTGP